MTRPPGRMELAALRSAGRIPAGAVKDCAARVSAASQQRQKLRLAAAPLHDNQGLWVIFATKVVHNWTKR